MLGRLTAWLAIRALKSKRLSGDDKARVASALVGNLTAVPVRDIVSFDAEGSVRVNGRKLDAEQASALMGSCMALKDNPARALINDQIAFEAIKIGVHIGMNQEQMTFAKAALWIIQEENRLLSQLVPMNLQDLT